MTLLTLPLDAIDDDALPRDRAALDPAALDELYRSILANGLRAPVEVFATADEGRYGLISGFRRMTVLRRLAAGGLAAFATVPAFLRSPASFADAMAQMVEENEVRADLTPWERGRLLVTAVETGTFATLDDALSGLFRSADKTRRTRLRALAELYEALDGRLEHPERLTQAQALRLANAIRGGFGEVIDTALAERRNRSAEGEQQLLAPILAEAERAARDRTPHPPGRPRRVLRLRKGLVIRRELRPEGWSLHFSGAEATSGLVEDVMDHVERMFGRR